MAAVTKAPGLPSSRLKLGTDPLNNSTETRSPDDFPSPNRSNSTSPHPDLNSEVATLSNKLISAINHQTNLDDSLAVTRQELENAHQRIRELEVQVKQHTALISSGAFVSKDEAEEQASRLVAKLAEERKRRTAVERDKKGIEQELENLTTALFEEANQMVAAARKDREAAERRSEQLRTQLNDTELLLASHQEQLAELKAVMQQMNSDREEPDATKSEATAPTTPASSQTGDLTKVADALHLSLSVPGVDDISPAPPTSFSHLLSPVLRTDLQSYEDFRSLIQVSRKSAPSSRVTSGSYSGVNVSGLSSLTNKDTILQLGYQPSNGSTASISTPGTLSQANFNTPIASATTVPSMASPVMPLKETKFYKRALTEDVEPTLRLDTAPGLSWLARRTVINSMCEGTLVVEPMPASAKMSVFSCALCGENRKGEEFARKHRFRTSENESAQRYPLCNYCLNRVRASCDYLGFLRMIKEGHWRTDGLEAEKLAWEESVRLRERMFWARIGGGVVPAFICRDFIKHSIEDAKPKTPFSAPPFISSAPLETGLNPSKENQDPFHPYVKRETSGKRYLDRNDANTANREDREGTEHTSSSKKISPSLSKPTEPTSQDSQTSLRDSLRPQPRSRAASYERERICISGDTTPQRASILLERNTSSQPTSDSGLSITIPGAFNY